MFAPCPTAIRPPPAHAPVHRNFPATRAGPVAPSLSDNTGGLSRPLLATLHVCQKLTESMRRDHEVASGAAWRTCKVHPGRPQVTEQETHRSFLVHEPRSERSPESEDSYRPRADRTRLGERRWRLATGGPIFKAGANQRVPRAPSPLISKRRGVTRARENFSRSWAAVEISDDLTRSQPATTRPSPLPHRGASDLRLAARAAAFGSHGDVRPRHKKAPSRFRLGA